jgi:hypothetical protein
MALRKVLVGWIVATLLALSLGLGNSALAESGCHRAEGGGSGGGSVGVETRRR